jgi:hypothetical protein
MMADFVTVGLITQEEFLAGKGGKDFVSQSATWRSGTYSAKVQQD